jgi:hypothetical protein
MSDSGACTAPSTQGKSLASGKALWREGTVAGRQGGRRETNEWYSETKKNWS